MDDDAGTFVIVGYHGYKNPPYYSILKLETSVLPHATPQQTPQQIDKIKVDAKRYVIQFNLDPGPPSQSVIWLFSPLKNSTADLYMVPNWGSSGHYSRTAQPLESYKFNLRDGTCETIKPPLSSKLEGHVVNVGGRIYLMGYDSICDVSVFQCYDPDEKSWKCLEPFPHDLSIIRHIQATAVLGNYILFNMECYEIWAYDVIKCKWYEVGVEDEICYSFEGEAVAVEDTIYALTKSFDVVLAFSIENEPNDGDLLLKCSSENLLPDFYPINYEDDDMDEMTWLRSRHLVHLGKDNFCIVQSCCLSRPNGYQDIKLTYVKLNGKNSVIVYECVYEVPTRHVDDQFYALLCFALPKGATTALEEGKTFELKPFPEAVQEDENNANPEQLGRSAYVRELPSKVTLGELEMGLKKFGPINGIQSRKIEAGKHRVFVEFESVTSKQLAIEMCPIMIGDCPVILEQRLTKHTLGDSNRTQGLGSSSKTT